MTQYLIPQRVDHLGRHVNHDERSRGFPAQAVTSNRWVTTIHKTHGLPLDQGNLGSCTGNAGVGVVNTEPNWYVSAACNEPLAVKLYGQGTTEDTYEGQYPPTDTGCDGLTIAKVMKEWGWITGYTHAFGLTQAVGALMLRPFMSGTSWLEAMSTPDADGRVHPEGDVVGGHEYVAYGADVVRTCFGRINHPRSKVWFMNSWGSEWGKAGAFYMTMADYGALLARDGDVVVPIRG